MHQRAYLVFLAWKGSHFFNSRMSNSDQSPIIYAANFNSREEMSMTSLTSSTTSTEKRPRSIRREMFNIVRDYSEYSTIQGVIYLFQSSQTQVGRLFWLLVIISMLALGTYWSVTAYNDWITNPVVTTVKTSALKIKNIEFPAVTICGQGVNDDIITAGFFKIFYNYTSKRNISYGMSPIRTVRTWKSLDDPRFKIDKEDMDKWLKIYSLLANDTDYLIGGYLDLYMPGFTSKDPLTDISPMLASRNPDDMVRMNVFKRLNLTLLCLNASTDEPKCQSGFTMDPVSHNCFMALNETRAAWDAKTVACSGYRASVVEFDDDIEVKGLIQLIQNGMDTLRGFFSC